MIQDEETMVRRQVRDLVISSIRRPGKRDQQRMLGPSDLANPCDLCLARKFAGSTGLLESKGKGNHSFKAWNGTAVHEKLEKDFVLPEEEAPRESRVFIEHIEGYGDVWGNVDLRILDLRTWVDYKTTDMSKLRNYRMHGVPEYHVNQTMLYGYGLRKLDLPPEYAVLVYLPRDSNNTDDIWVASARYDEEIATRCLQRAKWIYETVQQGRGNFLDSDDACYICTRFGRAEF